MFRLEDFPRFTFTSVADTREKIQSVQSLEDNKVKSIVNHVDRLGQVHSEEQVLEQQVHKASLDLEKETMRLNLLRNRLESCTKAAKVMRRFEKEGTAESQNNRKSKT